MTDVLTTPDQVHVAIPGERRHGIGATAEVVGAVAPRGAGR
jgi:hypothetical protein